MAKQSTTYASLKLTEENHLAYEMALHDFRPRQRYPMFSSGTANYHDYAGFNRRIIEDFNPSSMAFIVSRFPEANQKDVNEAVRNACKAFPEVKKAGWEKRLEILKRARPLIEQRKHEIAAVLTLEVGKTRSEAIAEVCEVMEMIDAYDKFLTEANFYERVLADGSERPYERAISNMEPVGPVPVIVPFNFPFALCANMSMAAFLAGNPVIIKPPEDAPLASLYWRNILVHAGAPGEAVLFLPGDGKVGKMLVNHPSPQIGRIAFTGSKEVGVEINIACAGLGKYGINRRVIAELGSRNPVIVTKHADLAKAASGIVRSATGFSGQKCSATSRVYVEEKVMDDLMILMTDLKFLEPYKVGDPTKRETWTGPLINQETYDRYQRIFAELQARGVNEAIRIMPLCSAETVDAEYMRDMQKHGYYVTPLLVTGIDHNDHLARDEHFVPFVTIHPVKSLKEGVQKANDTDYGLCAGLFSDDPDEQKYFNDRINFGVVYTNRALGATSGSWPGMQSFGGWGMSGLGGLNAFGPWYPLLFAREQCRTICLR